MEERPLITFALLAYNQEQFIEEAVQSALLQTYSPLEIILSDDGSSDRTYEIMSKMASKYKGPHTIILNQNRQNLGLVPHFNKVAIKLSHGELFIASAGDDISLPERTKTLFQAWENTGRKVYALSSGVTKIDIHGGVIGEIIPPQIGYCRADMTDFILNPFGHGCIGCSAAYHREIFDLFGELSLTIVEDTSSFIRARLLGEIFFIDDVLVRYRITGLNISKPSDRKIALSRSALLNTKVYEQMFKDMEIHAHKQHVTDVERSSIKSFFDRRIIIERKQFKLINGGLFERVFAWCFICFFLHGGVYSNRVAFDIQQEIKQHLRATVWVLPSSWYHRFVALYRMFKNK